MATTSLDNARSAKSKLAAQLADHPAVRGIGIARSPDGYCVKVNLAQPEPAGLELPDHVEGVVVIVEVVDRIVRR